MRKPVYMLYRGDSRKVLATLQDKSVHCFVTSVPFYLLRGYRGRGAIGFEETIELWAKNLVQVAAECYRVLRDDGMMVWVDGEAFYTNRSFAGPGTAAGGAFKRKHEAMGDVVARKLPRHHDLKQGDVTLQGPYLAECLRKWGWFLRSVSIISFTNPTPQGSGKRPVQTHQYAIIVTKHHTNYYWDKVSSRERGVAHDRLRRSVWEGSVEGAPVFTVDGKSFKHTSIMPQWVTEICLSAAIGEKGCCPQCYAQWVPIYSKGKGGSTGSSWHPHDNDIENGNAKTTSSKDYVPPSIKGWKPGCRCGKGKETVPAIVCDPFNGIAGTGITSMNRGADYIGIDLDPRCIKASRIRLREHEKTLVLPPLFDSRKAAREQEVMFGARD